MARWISSSVYVSPRLPRIRMKSTTFFWDNSFYVKLMLNNEVLVFYSFLCTTLGLLVYAQCCQWYHFRAIGLCSVLSMVLIILYFFSNQYCTIILYIYIYNIIYYIIICIIILWSKPPETFSNSRVPSSSPRHDPSTVELGPTSLGLSPWW